MTDTSSLVTLGVCYGKILPSNSSSSPYISKIGGKPAFYTNGKAINEFACKVCQSKENMIMVAQIYAPIDDIDRTLYFFACNQRQCSENSSSWLIFRDQQKATDVMNATSEIKSASTGSALAAKVPVKVQDSIWDNLTSDASDDVTFDDLEALLEARDNNNKTTSSLSIPTAPQEATPSITASKSTPPINKPSEPVVASGHQQWWPAYSITEEDEPTDQSNDRETGGTDDEHIRNIYRSYIVDEEDKNLTALLTSTSLTSFPSAKPNTSIAVSAVPHTNDQPDLDSDTVSGDKEDASVSEEDLMDELENRSQQGDEARKIELNFQAKCSLQPRQVLRYAYGSQPLWCTSPPPITDDYTVPVCAQCGSSRVYEMQLMGPAVLALSLPGPRTNSSTYNSNTKPSSTATTATPPTATTTTSTASTTAESLNSNSSNSSNTANNNRKVFDESLLGEGLQFGVAVVYSCPLSCPPPTGMCICV